MLSRGRATAAEQVACIEADITALQARLRECERNAAAAAEAQARGLIVSRDARMAQEFAELMADVLRGQIEEQFAARDALIPKPREASE